MNSLFPTIEPLLTDWLERGDGHRLYFEVCGNPQGVPVAFLHGGPGSSINPGHRRFFDPKHYRIILFDQRGCGRSTPAGEVLQNTTAHLIDDMERLREHLGVERWMLFGGSWGSTLAIAYAQAFSARVIAMILRGLFLASRAEFEWYLEGLRRFVPDAWAMLVKDLPNPDCASVIAHYHQRVSTGDREFARRWDAYESAVMAIGEAPSSASAAAPGDALVSRARVQLHYMANGCFLEPGQLMNAMPRIASIPARLVQGRRDLVCPPVTAYTVAQAWPAAKLNIVEEGGHSALHPAMSAALVQATEEMKTL